MFFARFPRYFFLSRNLPLALQNVPLGYKNGQAYAQTHQSIASLPIRHTCLPEHTFSYAQNPLKHAQHTHKKSYLHKNKFVRQALTLTETNNNTHRHNNYLKQTAHAQTNENSHTHKHTHTRTHTDHIHLQYCVYTITCALFVSTF